MSLRLETVEVSSNALTCCQVLFHAPLWGEDKAIPLPTNEIRVCKRNMTSLVVSVADVQYHSLRSRYKHFLLSLKKPVGGMSARKSQPLHTVPRVCTLKNDDLSVILTETS